MKIPNAGAHVVREKAGVSRAQTHLILLDGQMYICRAYHLCQWSHHCHKGLFLEVVIYY